MRIALAQLNPTIGDFVGNRLLIEQAARKAADAGAKLIVFSEMVLTGYPPLDLLERRSFIEDQQRALTALLPASQSIAMVLGVVSPVSQAGPRHLANSAVVLAGGAQVAVQHKTLLPAYDVFDENRYFIPAHKRTPITLSGVDIPIGIALCEDSWSRALGYETDPVAELVQAGAGLILNLAASPWHVGKPRLRRHILSELAQKHRVPIVFVNQCGGNDELIFDGGSCVVDRNGHLRAMLPLFEENLTILDLDAPPLDLAPEQIIDMTEVEQLETGLVLGVRDYFHKQGLPPRAVVGLSGGIDSAVVAYLAVQALGAENVLGVLMPGPFSSQHSVTDAEALAKSLGIETRTVDIRPVYEQYLKIFASLFGAKKDYGLASQNIQSRTRGAILMALSNAEGRLVLATGNKSELSVGYCTLYGDMVGGLSVLGDVYKRDVYALARHANREQECIPRGSLEKPPSAELAPNQRDQDDLPPYEVLDLVLHQAVELARSGAEIVAPPGQNPQLVREIAARLDRNEYKRRQGPLVLRTSPKAFGSGRRFPIAHRYCPDTDR